MNNQQYQAPWDRPEVKAIISIFGGRVVSTKQINLVDGYSYGGDDNGGNDDIQR